MCIFLLSLEFLELVQKKVARNQYFFFFFLRRIQRLSDTSFSALSLALSLWDELWCAAEMVSLSVQVCAARLTPFSLPATASMLLSGALIQGSDLD